MMNKKLKMRELKSNIKEILSKITGLSIDEIEDNEEFVHLGMDSFMLILFRKRLQKKFGIELMIHDLFEDYKTVRAVAYKIEAGKAANSENQLYDQNLETDHQKLKRKGRLSRIFDLTGAEKRLYLLSQIKEGNQAYQICYCFEISEHYSSREIRNAFVELSHQHDIMRSCYILKDGMVKRHVLEMIDICFHETTLDSVMKEDSFMKSWKEPFAMDRAPLWKVAIVRDLNNKRKLYFNIHHIISDGKSIDIILEEIRHRLDGKTDRVKKLSSGFDMLLEAEKQNLLSVKAEKQKKWWLKKFEDIPEPLNLPVGEPRKQIFDFRGETQHFLINEKISRRINEMLEGFQVTNFMFFLSMWVLLLHKLSEQNDLCIGVPWDLRSMGDFECTLGMFVQTLPLRFRIDEEESYLSFLHKVKEECLSSYEHAEYPLDNIVNALNPIRDMGRNPLFDVIFTYELGEQRRFATKYMSGNVVDLPSSFSMLDMTVEMLQYQKHYTFSVNYTTPLYSAAQIKKWVKGYFNLLDSIVEDPEQFISDINLLGTSEKKYILNLGQGLPCKSRENIPANIFADAFKNYENNTAIWFKGQEMTYAELNERVNKLVNLLEKADVKKGQVMGVLSQRTPGIIIALLAAQRLGVCWMPIDPEYPADRINYMLKKSEADILLVDGSVNPDVYKVPRYINMEESEGESALVTVEYRNFNSGDLCYILFTSGSTGVPKGIEMENRSVANFIYAMHEVIQWEEKARVACVTSCSFDIFLFETLCSLAAGSCIVLFGDHDAKDPKKFLQIVEEAEVTYLQLTPTRLQLLCMDDGISDGILRRINKLILGGEAFPVQLLSRLQMYNNLKILNLYAPTETCIYSTFKDMTESNYVTIGKPVSNVQAYILDDGLNLQPEGEKGVLWIGGAGVARGYVNAPELTEEKFIKNPFGEGRIYNTGDVAMWEDGEILLAGRADSQVKVRGYRIELTEIENVIKSHAQIEHAVVAVTEQVTGTQSLLAYYVTKGKSTITIKELKKWVGQKLPSYMIPFSFVKLKEIPQTQSGKADRTLLASKAFKEEMNLTKEQDNLISGTNDLKMDDIEKILYSIWCSVLGQRDFDITQTYFDIGGNSFSLVILADEINKVFPRMVEVTDLFLYSTVNSQCQFITKQLNKQDLRRNMVKIDKRKEFSITDDRELRAGLQHVCNIHSLDLKGVLSGMLALFLRYERKENKVIIADISGTKAGFQLFDFEEINDLSQVFLVSEQQKNYLNPDIVIEYKKSGKILCGVASDWELYRCNGHLADLVFYYREECDGIDFINVSMEYPDSKWDMKRFAKDFIKFIKNMLTSIMEGDYING